MDKRDIKFVVILLFLFVGTLTILFGGKGYYDARQAKRSTGASQLATDPDFKPVPTDNLPFEASLLLKPAEGAVFRGAVQHDGNGTIRLEAKQDDESLELYITPTHQIFCELGECFRDIRDDSDPLFSVESFIYNQQDLPGIGAGLLKNGQVQCGESTCDVWGSPSFADTLSKVLIEQGTNRIISIEGLFDGDSIKIDYQYNQVKIILPLNVDDLPESSPLQDTKPSIGI